MEKPQQTWSVPVAVEDIPETGLHMEIEAPPAARAQLAELAGLRQLSRLSGVFELTRRGAGVHVAGRVSALVGQTCVVSLEPIESMVEEVVEVNFAPASPAAVQAHEIGSDEEEPAEPLIGGTIDLGAVATEFLLLGINPYPRKPGAEFAPPKVEEGGDKPFAALATLKKRLGGGET